MIGVILYDVNYFDEIVMYFKYFIKIIFNVIFCVLDFFFFGWREILKEFI